MSKSRRHASNPTSPSVHYTKQPPHLVSTQGANIIPATINNAEGIGNGHVVHPTLISQSSRLAVFTKAVRSYIPSLTSLNTSIGLGAATEEVDTTSPSGSTQRTGSTFGSYTTTQTKHASDPVLTDQRNDDGSNGIAWSRWITINERSLLVVAYAKGGLHVWDTSSLDAVREMLYLPSIGVVSSADVIPPPPHPLAQRDTYRMAIIVGKGADSVLIIYSLVNHIQLKRISIPDATSVSSNARFTVVAIENSQDVQSSSKHAKGLLVLSSSSLGLLSAIPISDLAPHTLSSPVYSLSTSRLLAYASAPPSSHRLLQANTQPPPGYPPTTLASASNFGLLSGVNLGDVMSGAVRLGTGVFEGVKKAGEIGMDAAGYGGTKPSTKAGGGRGIFSQSAPAAPSPLTSRLYSSKGTSVAQRGHVEEYDETSGEWVTVIDLQLLDREDNQEQEDIVNSPKSPTSSFQFSTPPLIHLDLSLPHNDKGVSIITEFMYTRQSSSDRPSRSSKRQSPAASSTHLASGPPTKAISRIAWNKTGTLLGISGIDGSTIRVFKVARRTRKSRPRGMPPSAVPSGGHKSTEADGWISEMSGSAELAYELVRGVTPAAIRDIQWSHDDLWSGAISSHGTLHAFTVSPNGELPDIRSYLEGRVINSGTTRASGARIQAVARLRQPIVPMEDPLPATLTNQDGKEIQQHPRRQSDSADLSSNQLDPLTVDPLPLPTCYFLPNSTSRLSQLLPVPPNGSPSTPPDSNSVSSGAMATGGFKDVLVFDPQTSLLGLWRCTLRPPNRNQGGVAEVDRGTLERSTSVTGVIPKDDTIGIAGKPRIRGGLSSRGFLSGITRIAGMNRAREGIASVLAGAVDGASWESAVIASWDLKRDDEWQETKGTFTGLYRHLEKDKPTINYLAQAELTTFPTRSLLLPRPIYLSHQFIFSALASDYHALVRRLDLNPASFPVMVRKESVIVRGMDDGPTLDYDLGTSAPSEFDSDANFLGNAGPLDLTDSPMLGGHLELAPESLPIPSSFASTSATSLSSHSQPRSGRKILRRSMDESLSSAIESHLRLDASYSPSGSSDVASPGRVIPMLPNGRPGSGGSGIVLDSIVRGTARVGKEVWGGLSGVRSPRTLPSKRSSGGGSGPDLLKFNEEDELFVVDDLEDDKLAVADIELEKAQDPAAIGESAATVAGDTGLTREGSVRTIGPGIWSVQSGFSYPLLTDSGMTIMGHPSVENAAVDSSNTPSDAKAADEGTWVAQPDLYTQAVEEDARFDDVTRILDEERAERDALQVGSVSKPARKNSGIAKGGRRTSSRDAVGKLAEFDADLSSDAKSAAASSKGGRRRAKKKR